MLFTKKVRFYVGEKQIKEELTSPEGTTVLRINLRYPDIVCPKNDPLSKSAAPLYQRLAKEFADYAKDSLASVAAKALTSSAEDFSPYSAVMVWEKTMEDENYLSIVLDISVSDGRNVSAERKTQVWDRKTGMKCRLKDFISAEKFKEISDEYFPENKKQIAKDLFVLSPEGILIFIRQGEGFRSVLIPKERFM